MESDIKKTGSSPIRLSENKLLFQADSFLRLIIPEGETSASISYFKKCVDRSYIVLRQHETVIVGTGIDFKLPSNKHLLIEPIHTDLLLNIEILLLDIYHDPIDQFAIAIRNNSNALHKISIGDIIAGAFIVTSESIINKEDVHEMLEEAYKVNKDNNKSKIKFG